MKQFTNEATQQMLADLDKSLFPDADLAAMDVNARQIIEQNTERDRQHPVTAIWRVAVEGSLTVRGGVVAAVDSARVTDLGDGQMVKIIAEGDAATYTDGLSAWTVSSAGQKATHSEKGLALVGSILDNGDEIVSTPQDRLVPLSRKGMIETPDFLAIPGGVTHGVSN